MLVSLALLDFSEANSMYPDFSIISGKAVVLLLIVKDAIKKKKDTI